MNIYAKTYIQHIVSCFATFFIQALLYKIWIINKTINYENMWKGFLISLSIPTMEVGTVESR